MSNRHDNPNLWESPGGEPADILYAGSAPGMACAAQQINVIVPEDVAPGVAVPVQLRMLRSWANGWVWYSAQTGVTLAIN